MHTSGKTYNEIIQPPFKRELIIEILTIITGCIISFIIKHPNPVVLIFVAFTITFLYGTGNLISYKVCVKKIFYQMSRRND